MSTVCHPAIALPEHLVTLDSLLDHFSAVYADRPDLDKALSAIRATTVETRWFSQPLDKVLAGPPGWERAAQHEQDAGDLACNAAWRALRHAELAPSDIDCLITVNISGYRAPGIDAYLINEMSLSPSVRRIPVTQFGCAGGAWALARAADQIAAYPGTNVLVVTVDLLSNFYQPTQTTMSGLIYKALFGDAAGACVVRGDDRATGIILGRSVDYILPNTPHYLNAWLGAEGTYFGSDPEVLSAPRKVIPELAAQLPGSCLQPDFAVIHPGGPRIMDEIADGFGWQPELLTHARASLAEIGNVGAPCILDVAARTFDSPPADGARGILLGFGPGFTAIATEATWRTGPLRS